MHLFPKPVVTLPSELRHGAPILTVQGGAGLVWDFAPENALQAATAYRRAVLLQDMSAVAINNVCLNAAYVLALTGELRLEVDRESLSTEAQAIAAGDIVFTAAQQKPHSVPLIALRMSPQAGLKGYSFTDAQVIDHLHQGYVYIFKRWKLFIADDDNAVLLAQRI